MEQGFRQDRHRPMSPPIRCRRRVADTFIMLKDRVEWPDPRKAEGELWSTNSKRRCRKFRATTTNSRSPIQMRLNELIAGVRADVAVKVFGDDLEQLHGSSGDAVEAVAEPSAGRRRRQARAGDGTAAAFDHAESRRLARYGFSLQDVQDTVSIALGGGARRAVLRRRPALRHRRAPARGTAHGPRSVARTAGAAAWRDDACIVCRIASGKCGASAASFVPLGEVATLEIAPGPNQISRENGKRRVVVTANVRGRDLGRLRGRPARTGRVKPSSYPRATGSSTAARSSN